jgi:hypothetical protein
VPECSQCGGSLERSFRFCPWCAAPLRSKLVEFFRAHPVVEADRGKALRVSRYLAPEPEDRHVRFSVWSESGRAAAVLSLDEAETERLRRFLAPVAPPRPQRVRDALERALADLGLRR